MGREYEVTLLIPHTYRITAESEQEAKEQASQRWAFAVNADSVGFPVEMTLRVKETTTNA